MSYRSTYFPDLETPAYLAHAAISPINRRAREAMAALVAEYGVHGVKAWGTGGASRTRLRESLARLLGTDPQHVGMVNSTSHGLLIVACEFPWQRGDRLVLVRGEFPGNVIPWLMAAERFGLEVLWLELEDLAERNARFRQVMERRPRLLAISWVQFQTGYTQDLAELSRLRESHDLAICLDAIQGFGVLPIDMAQTPLDFVVGGGQKWLLGPEGAAWLYVDPAWMPRFRPLFASWLSGENAADFLFKGAGLMDYGNRPRLDPSRYEMATMSNVLVAGLEQGVAILFEVGLEVVHERVTGLARRCRVGLRDLGFDVHMDRANAGIASFRPPSERFQEMARALDEAGCTISTPDGFIRMAPHFYNEEADIDRCLEVLERFR